MPGWVEVFQVSGILLRISQKLVRMLELLDRLVSTYHSFWSRTMFGTLHHYPNVTTADFSAHRTFCRRRMSNK